MDRNKPIIWTWSNGDKCIKSPRQVYQQQQSQQYPVQINTSEQAYNQSLLSETDVWSIDEIPVINKREDTYNKISERELISQTGKNPFMTGNNYLDGLSIQDQYMKPQNTTTIELPIHSVSN